MVTLLRKLFLKNGDTQNKRKKLGSICGIVGIFLNVLLFAAKMLAGFLSGSIAIMADAFNNLSDAASSVISLFGFVLSDKKPDPDHPFGHGRFEYISGFLVSVFIMSMGLELIQSSFSKILSPETVSLQWVTVGILLLSVMVKLYMMYYNKKIGDEIDSSSMKAASVDSLSDCIATTAVLGSAVLMHFTGWKIDGWIGLIVSIMIIYAGYGAAKDTLSPLLGRPPKKEFVEQIHTIVLSYPEIIGMHDLIVHDYGPGRIMVSLHAEIPIDADLQRAHEIVDDIEMDINEQLGCETTIHIDPLETENEVINDVKSITLTALNEIDPSLTLHDFRMVSGVSHTNLIFDIVKPFSCALTDKEITDQMAKKITAIRPNFRCVIKIDKPYV